MHRPARLNIILGFLCLPVFAASTVESVSGVGNFHKVNEHLYRGAQPTEEGFRNLAKLGVKRILDLRENDSRTLLERRMVTNAGMEYINVPMTGLTPPTEQETAKVLALMEDETSGPIFVHCKEGKDRTGAVIAAYRIDHDGWDNVRALQEARTDHMSFFQIPRQNYIKNFKPRNFAAKAPATVAQTTTDGTAPVLDAKAAVAVQ